MASQLQEKKIEQIVERAVERAIHKAFFDRELSEALDEIRKGKTYGPFKSGKAFLSSLHRESRKLNKS